jgi:nucleoredoxin
MPWTAFPYGDARIEALNNLFEVEGIPTCILLDGDSLRVLQKDLIPHVVSDPQGAKFPWKPEPVSDLGQSFMGSINEVASFLLLLPAGHKAR